MIRNRSRLERVERVRSVEEELARVRFSAAEADARAAEALAEERRAAIAHAVDDLRGLQGTPSLAPAQVIAALSCVDRARDTWRSAHERALTLRFQAEELRAAWHERLKDKKGVSRLVERVATAERIDAERDASNDMDETAARRARYS
jgi:flagellar biosynthesis chaperone FliJ